MVVAMLGLHVHCSLCLEMMCTPMASEKAVSQSFELTWVYNRYKAIAICAGKLQSSCRLAQRLITRSASTDISV